MSHATDSQPGNRLVTAAAGVTAASALACGTCCILPFALPATLVAMSGGVLAFFVRIHPLVTVIAVMAVAAGWAWVVAKTLQTRRRPPRGTLIAMSVATVMLTVSMMWPVFEHTLFNLFRIYARG
jgi:hypothetical protein